jgi:hypothetical protein
MTLLVWGVPLQMDSYTGNESAADSTDFAEVSGIAAEQVKKVA